MAFKYKISKTNLNEFFGLFGKKKEDRAKKINDLIANDPILKKLDKEIGDLNNAAIKRLAQDPMAVDVLKKYGIELK